MGGDGKPRFPPPPALRMQLDDSTYGDRQADTYDAFREEVFGGEDVTEEVAFLARQAGDGPALELGVGTGRVALPLAREGLRVVGLDASELMLERLRNKTNDESINALLAHIQTFTLSERFSLAYCVSNTFLQLTTRDEQRSCFSAVARHLLPNGVFVIDAWIANPERFTRNQAIGIWHMDAGSVHLEVSRLDPRTAIVETQQVILRQGEPVRLNPMLQRETTLQELDEYASATGFALEQRLSSWDGSAHSDQSPRAISVYRRDAAGP